MESLERMIKNLTEKIGMTVNMKKTKIMLNNQLVGWQVMTGNETLEIVEECMYPGQKGSSNSESEKLIIKRIGMG